ncbi:MAG: type I-E CRISPR-associated protein Cas6/Cse3/CasE [Gallionella sp.]|nr:MAG: type I-E CRISPR-associated protein Cas6/Cse3/CasE [Gallionella sp.]
MSYFSRIRLKPGLDLAQLVRLLPTNAYAEHKLVWQWFGEEQASRDFLFRREQQGHWPFFYVLSQREPVAPPHLWEVESRPYQPRLADGERLAFMLRANPVRVRKISDDRAVKTRRRDDVVADLKKRRYADRAQRPPMAVIVREGGEQWLAERAENGGFELESLNVEGYHQQRLYKRGAEQPIYLSTVEFSGILRVADAGKFIKRLHQGIGPAKAFGCGLLLVRRV